MQAAREWQAIPMPMPLVHGQGQGQALPLQRRTRPHRLTRPFASGRRLRRPSSCCPSLSRLRRQLLPQPRRPSQLCLPRQPQRLRRPCLLVRCPCPRRRLVFPLRRLQPFAPWPWQRRLRPLHPRPQMQVQDMAIETEGSILTSTASYCRRWQEAAQPWAGLLARLHRLSPPEICSCSIVCMRIRSPSSQRRACRLRWRSCLRPPDWRMLILTLHQPRPRRKHSNAHLTRQWALWVRLPLPCAARRRPRGDRLRRWWRRRCWPAPAWQLLQLCLPPLHLPVLKLQLQRTSSAQ